jgi:hypothetical protein
MKHRAARAITRRALVKSDFYPTESAIYYFDDADSTDFDKHDFRCSRFFHNDF